MRTKALLVPALLLLVLLTLILTGCTVGNIPTPSNTTPPVAVAMGGVQDIAPGVTASALSYTDPTPYDKGDRKIQSVGVDVQVCDAVASSVTDTRWTLIDSVGHIYTNTYNPYDDAPMYPEYADTTAGQCVQGRIAFRLPKDAIITTVRYTAITGVFDWMI